MDKRIAEAWVLGIISILAIYFMGLAYRMPSTGGISPRSFPLIIFWSLLGLNAVRSISLIKNFRRNPPTEKGEAVWKVIPKLPRKTVMVIGMIIAYIILFKAAGFVLASSLFILGVSWYLTSTGRSPGRHIAISAAVALAIYLLFVYGFKLQLPQGILGGVL